jgi:hypothetical protein
MSTSEPLVIQTQGLSKSYKQVDALKSLDLQVPILVDTGHLGRDPFRGLCRRSHLAL